MQTNDTNVAYDIQTIINQMNTETVSQSWFRFFHIIGKPIEFCDVNAISKNLELARSARLQKDIENLTTPTNFSCIKKLPIIFLEVLKGISRIVDAFLGISYSHQSNLYSSPPHILLQQKTSTTTLNNPSLDQKLRSKSVMAADSKFLSNTTQGKLQHQDPMHALLKINPYKTNRPGVDSLLHLVGQCLFEAAACRNVSELNQAEKTSRDYILGQAEAYGILCKIFCSVKTNEPILAEYLSRFYSLVLIGLKIPPNFGDFNSNMEYESGEILASIIVNGHNMFKLGNYEILLNEISR